MIYQVKLDIFEGPLDLLLHLISKSKLNIEDISISDITNQYLEYLHQMEVFNIDIASEFLVMAATLLHIKSSKLLPRAVPENDEEETDPQQQLIQKLKEYKKYKDASNELYKRYMVYSNMCSKLPEEIVDTQEEGIKFTGITKYDILKTMLELLTREKKTEAPAYIRPIKKETISLGSRIKQIRNTLKMRSRILFSELIDKKRSRLHIVVTFIALLEMASRGWIEVKQYKPFSDFAIQRKGLKWTKKR
ncbi:MAG: segregation/condensation protein A [Clostridiales bacterium]|nr:segregation/condensation protein A [Clostridiales bacterium]